MASPFDWLLPDQGRRTNPMAWVMANQQQPEGLVPDDLSMDEMGFSMDAGKPHTVSNAVPSMPADPTPAPPGQPMQPTNQMPTMPKSGGGQWESYVQQPGVREFLISTGLQLMASGNIGQALAHGITDMSNAQRDAQMQQMGLSPDGRGAQDVADARSGRRRSRGGRVARGTGIRLTPAQRGASAFEDRQAQAVAEFIQSNPTPEQWAQANQPGGLIPAVFGGPQDQANARALLVQVQDRATAPGGPGSRMPQTGSRRDSRDTPSGEELIGMLQSSNPGLRAEGQAWARRLYGSAGPGKQWGFNEQGQLVPVGGDARGGRPQGRFEAASRAGVQSARLDVQNIRDYINNQLPVLGQMERSGSLSANVGPYANLVNNMRNAVASYMHARSGAQTSVKEFEHYVDTFLPRANELHYSTQGKLANLELQVMLIGRMAGEHVSTDDLYRVHNEHRRWNGLPPMTPEQFEAILPRLEQETAAGLPTGRAQGRTSVPGVTTTPQGPSPAPAPSPVPNPAPAPTPGGAATPADSPPLQGARKAPDGNWYVPDPSRPGSFLRVDR